MTSAPFKLNMVFHHPSTLKSDGNSGSQVRPYKMLCAFRQAGINVSEVTGDARQRSQKIRAIKRRVDSGETFDFVYSESLSIPFAMSEAHRLPTHPFLDHNFLSFCDRNNIPVAMFYRDIFWRDNSYAQKLPWWARLITIPLYHFDWKQIKNHTTLLYLPSLEMASHLPDTNYQFQVLSLPPASSPHVTETKTLPDDTLKLLYIGGIEPPIYDLTPLLDSMQKSSSTKLTICCRKTEWHKYKHLYERKLTEHIKIVHKSGKELNDLYKEADIQTLIRHPNDYLDFAVPVKLFESIGHGVPVLSTPNSEAARIIEKEGLGWVKDFKQIPHFLMELRTKPWMIRRAKLQVKNKQNRHSWEERARNVCEDIIRHKQAFKR
ncbi:hypothetical protein [Marinobacter sp.]|uniref:hypothetical protein n=1 Tax=Marinobacter sp. TaxID=50741 RepID=UPI002B26A053|nr:hypothetical protein [Marinobacter sp.]